MIAHTRGGLTPPCCLLEISGCLPPPDIRFFLAWLSWGVFLLDWSALYLFRRKIYPDCSDESTCHMSSGVQLCVKKKLRSQWVYCKQGMHYILDCAPDSEESTSSLHRSKSLTVWSDQSLTLQYYRELIGFTRIISLEKKEKLGNHIKDREARSLSHARHIS